MIQSFSVSETSVFACLMTLKCLSTSSANSNKALRSYSGNPYLLGLSG